MSKKKRMGRSRSRNSVTSNHTNGVSMRTINVSYATAKHGNIRTDHGVNLTFDLSDQGNLANLLCTNTYETTFGIDFAGNIYSGIPIPGVESLAQWMLPLSSSYKLNVDRKKFVSFMLGAKSLSKETLLTTLNNLNKNGNPMFSIDLIFTKNSNTKEQLIIRGVTCASKMLSSLTSSPSKKENAIVVLDELKKDSEWQEYTNLISLADNRRNLTFRICDVWPLFRYFFFPLIFTLFAWWLIFTNEITDAVQTKTGVLFSDSIPRLVRFGMVENETNNVTNIYGYTMTAPGIEFELPPVPKTRSVAFKLGAVWAKLGGGKPAKTGSTAVLSAAEQAILFEEASTLLNRPSSTIQTVDQLTSILTSLLAEDNDVTVTVSQRVYGMFSTINVIWLISIIGISVSIFPSLYYMLKPLRECLYRCWKQLLTHVIEPTIRRCHNWGIFELCAWSFSFCVVLDAHRYYGLEAGRYIGITGACFSVLAFLYSTATHGGKVTKILNVEGSKGREKMMKKFIFRYSILSCLPLSLVFGSDFLGFIAVAATFQEIGFGGFAGTCCYCIGFSDKDSLIRCSFASLSLISSMVGLKVFESSLVPHLAPLQTPISVFGSLVLHIALLIVSSKHLYNGLDGKDKVSYIYRNFLMFVVLLLGQFFGATYGLDGLQNSSSIFMVLYLWTKSQELLDNLQVSFRFSFFCLSKFLNSPKFLNFMNSIKFHIQF